MLLASPAWSQPTEDVVLIVDKQVDADGDGVFADVEDARSATSPVTFRVVVTNAGEDSLEIVTAVDVVGETTIDLVVDAACSRLTGTLEPSQTVTCTFTLDRYLRTHAGPPRNELTNRVEVVATSPDDGIVTAAAEATVRNPNASQVSVEVDLTTDADGDGDYTDDEQAPTAGADVPIRVEIRNTSPGAVVVTTLDLARPGLEGSADMLALCPALDGMKLWGVGGGDHDGGDHDVAFLEDAEDGHDGHDRPTSTTCSTTLDRHAPASGTSVADTATVTVAKRHSPELTATASDAARMWVAEPTPAPTPAPVVVPPRTDVDPAVEVPTPPAPPPASVPDTETPAAVPLAPAPSVPAPVALPATGVPTGAALGVASLLGGLALVSLGNRWRRPPATERRKAQV